MTNEKLIEALSAIADDCGQKNKEWMYVKISDLRKILSAFPSGEPPQPRCPKCGDAISPLRETYSGGEIIIRCLGRESHGFRFGNAWSMSDFAQFFGPSAPQPQPSVAELPLARMILKFLGSHEAFGDFASLTSCAGAFAPIVDAARKLIEGSEQEPKLMVSRDGNVHTWCPDCRGDCCSPYKPSPSGSAGQEPPFKLPDELLGGAVKVIRPTDLRNRVGSYMVEQHGLHIGDKVDAGKVQDMIEEFFSKEIKSSARKAAEAIAQSAQESQNWTCPHVDIMEKLIVDLLHNNFTGK